MSTEPAGATRSRFSDLSWIAAIAATWMGVLAVPWQFDDWPTIVRDPATRDFASFVWRLGHGVRPLLRASFLLDDTIWGMSPFGFHLTNLLLHLATAAGVGALARRRVGSDMGAMFAGLVFALQPANAEVVAYVSGRSTGLMTALLVAALLAREHARDDAGRARRWATLEVAFFALACLAKEVALVYPALAAWWEATRPVETRATAPQPGFDARAMWSTTVPGLPRAPRALLSLLPLAIVVAAGAVALAALPRYRELAAFSFALRGPLHSLAINARAVPEMLSLWARPWALCVDHAFDTRPDPLATAAGAALIVAIAAAAIALRRRVPILALALGWPLLALIPTNSLVAKLDPVTEKPLYLAWIGPALLIAAVLAMGVDTQILKRREKGETPQWGPWFFAIVVVASLSVRTVVRVSEWRDPRRLWLEAVREAPKNARAWNNLGMAFHEAHDDRTAIRALRRAVELDPHDGLARRNLGRLDAALDE
ncbi:MAG TPA: tetratricopeptide repeat protein [bacterium]|nr:tetratricopeptide repeat protein [bacterium]